MSNHFPINVVRENNGTKYYTRVGVLFQNETKDGKTVFNIQLDFPVGVTEMVAFEPKPKQEEPPPHT